MDATLTITRYKIVSIFGTSYYLVMKRDLILKRKRFAITQNGIVFLIFVKHSNAICYVIISRPIKIQSLPKFKT